MDEKCPQRLRHLHRHRARDKKTQQEGDGLQTIFEKKPKNRCLDISLCGHLQIEANDVNWNTHGDVVWAGANAGELPRCRGTLCAYNILSLVRGDAVDF